MILNGQQNNLLHVLLERKLTKDDLRNEANNLLLQIDSFRGALKMLNRPDYGIEKESKAVVRGICNQPLEAQIRGLAIPSVWELCLLYLISCRRLVSKRLSGVKEWKNENPYCEGCSKLAQIVKSFALSQF